MRYVRGLIVAPLILGLMIIGIGISLIVWPVCFGFLIGKEFLDDYIERTRRRIDDFGRRMADHD